MQHLELVKNIIYRLLTKAGCQIPLLLTCPVQYLAWHIDKKGLSRTPVVRLIGEYFSRTVQQGRYLFKNTRQSVEEMVSTTQTCLP